MGAGRDCLHVPVLWAQLWTELRPSKCVCWRCPPQDLRTWLGVQMGLCSRDEGVTRPPGRALLHWHCVPVRRGAEDTDTQGRPRGDPGGTASAQQRGAPGQTRRGETAAQTPSLQDEEGKSCRPSHAVWLPVVAAQRRSAAALTVTVEPPRGQRVHAREHEGGWKRASQGVTSVCSQSHRRRSRVCFSRPWL